MSSLWFAVTVTLVIAVGKLVQADSEPVVLVNVYDSEKGKNYTIDFSHDAFASFHECLCDVDNNICCAEADRKYPLSEKTYEVKQFTKCGSLYDGLRHKYSNIFNCALYVTTPTTVQCYRVRNDQTAIATYPTDTPYQIFSLGKQKNECGHQCISVKWNSRQPVESILLLPDQSVPLYKGSCYTSTPVPSSSHLEIPITDIDPFSTTITTGTVKPAEHTNGEQVVNKDSVSDNHIQTSKFSVMGLGVLLPIIISVVIIVIIVLTVTFVIIWTRRKRQLQPSTTALHSPGATEVISLNNGEELNGINIGDDEHPNPREFSCEACDKEIADESRIQDEDTQAGAYASPAEVISKKTTIAPGFTSVQIQETELVHGNDNVSDTVTAPGDSQSDYTIIDVYSRLGDQDRQFENPYDDMTPLKDKVSAEKGNTDAQESLENSSLAISSLSNHPDAYSRLGDQVRQFENPYDDMAALKNKVSAERDNTDAQDSLESSSQAMSISNQNNVPVEVTRSTNQSFTNRAYECVDVENMPTSTSTNDAFNNEAMFEPGCQAIYTTIDGVSADSGETEHTKCPSGELGATLNVYAKLGESVKNIENPYDG